MAGVAVPAAGARKGKSGGFPAEYKRLRGSSARLAWLAGPDCGGLVTANALQKSKVEAEVRRIGKQENTLRPTFPTPARMDDWRRGEHWPPKADHASQQVRTARYVVNEHFEAKTLWSPHYIRPDGEMEERAIWRHYCRERRLMGAGPRSGIGRESTTSSPSAAALAEIRDQSARVEFQVKLEPEDTASLRAEIAAAYGAGRAFGFESMGR
jgi:hypothetical protein